MTAVVVAPRVEDMDSDTEAVLSGAFFRVRPSVAYSSGGQWVTDEWPPLKPINGAPVTVQLDAHGTVPYEIEVFAGGDMRTPIIHEFRMVTASASPLNWQDLELVTGPTGEAVPTDTQAAINAALWAAIGGVSGGATNLAGITDMSPFMRTVNDDTSASAARTTLGAADDTAVVHLAGTETITGAKTIGTLTVTTAATVPTPTSSGHAATKGYVDSTISVGAPDATTGVKGIVQLAGDLAGTATSPSVAKVKGVTISATAPTTGQALVATSGTAASWQDVTTPTIDGTEDVPGLDTALAGKRGTNTFEAGEMIAVRKDPTTGFWPASWSGRTPVYTGGSASAGVRPTSLATVTCVWIGPDPSPAIVSSGTGGMRDDARDLRFKHG